MASTAATPLPSPSPNPLQCPLPHGFNCCNSITISISKSSSMSSSTASSSNYSFAKLGFGYAIAIALAFLVLLSALLLAFYVCCRASRSRNLRLSSSRPPPSRSDAGIILPQIIFVAEDDGAPDRDDDNGVVGLDQAVINSYPKFPFSKDKSMAGANCVCSICLCEYKEAEMLRMMPECRHYFHLCCIDAWLKLNGSCPVCRNSPLPTPLSTPLQEVVPLSQYMADRRRR
ncbi:RING-H2 finger protein ATL67-like isoform X1 [Cucurbita maxima]|uniref:RING-H2 finger protein ATL67-like isoform X1 n=2 Tax=Cucurbita maxima TaxID=3661 RepID=A0A6J1IAW3_CUCMA|nr:RING-H2 finger protein ATL67-like isoform X1 [Cucurbita maxima]